MQTFSPITEQIIELALTEDLVAGDMTTDAICDDGRRTSRGYLVAKADIVLCGQHVFEYVVEKVQNRAFGAFEPVTVEFLHPDGARLEKGTKIATFSGSTNILLKAERTALNFFQHMSGVATQTHAMAQLLGPKIKLVNTRKVLAGMRELDHYAVQCGGGYSHRFNLGGGIMIKDNHIAAAGSITKAVSQCREFAPHTLKIEVEVTSLDEVREALAAGADIIMLDNMTHDVMKEACDIIGNRALIEISGNVTVESAEQIRDLRVQYVSSGSLTHSVRAADISMLFER